MAERSAKKPKKKTALAGKPRKGPPAKKRQPPSPAAAAFAYVVKSEPFVYSFDQLVADKKTAWEGVRNFEARNTLRQMKKGDLLLYYHSNEGKEIVGIARVAKEAYPDPTSEDDWSAVDITPVKKLAKTVTLAAMKVHPVLSKMPLVTRGRISVTPVTEVELRAVLDLAATPL